MSCKRMWASVVVLVAAGLVLTGCLTETGGPSSPAPRLTTPLTTEGGQTNFSTGDTVYVTFGGPAGTYYYYLEYESTPNSFSTTTQADDLYCWYRNLATGEHTLTVYFESGGQRSPTYTLTFTVGGGGSGGDSYEWDGSASSATSITINGYTQSHTITASDTDWYSFSATSGQVCTLQTFGSMDTKMYLYQSNATTLIEYDDDDGVSTNALIAWTCSASGTYYFKVVGLSSSTTGSYTASVTAPTSGGDSYEYDGSSSYATTITIGGLTQSHTITASDTDWYSFSATSGQVCTLQTFGSMDTKLYLYQSNATTLIEYDDDDGVSTNALIAWTCSSSGTYYFKVMGLSSSTTGSYTASVTALINGGDSYEHDGSWLSATPITINGSTQAHTITANDTDWYSFSATSGQVCTLQTFGSTDTKMNLYQTNGTTLITSDDDGPTTSNPLIIWTCSTTGTYYFYVVGYNSSTTGSYTVSATTGASAGDSYEPDGTLDEANAIIVGGTAQSHSVAAGDSDWVYFYAYSGSAYTLTTGGSVDVEMELYDDSGGLVNYDSDSGVNLNPLITLNCTTSGYYYIRTYGFSGATGAYTLLVTSP